MPEVRQRNSQWPVPFCIVENVTREFGVLRKIRAEKVKYSGYSYQTIFLTLNRSIKSTQFKNNNEHNRYKQSEWKNFHLNISFLFVFDSFF